MLSVDENTTPDAIAKAYIARIREADRQANESSYAFAIGKFDEYWDKQRELCLEAMRDEYARLKGDDPATKEESDTGGDAGSDKPEPTWGGGEADR